MTPTEAVRHLQRMAAAKVPHSRASAGVLAREREALEMAANTLWETYQRETAHPASQAIVDAMNAGGMLRSNTVRPYKWWWLDDGKRGQVNQRAVMRLVADRRIETDELGGWYVV